MLAQCLIEDNCYRVREVEAAGRASGHGDDGGAGGVAGVVGFRFCADVDVGEMVTVRPSLLKLAITGMAAFTVTTAAPLLSL